MRWLALSRRYDGQVFVKPPEVLTRDRLLGTYEVKPVLARLRLVLGVWHRNGVGPEPAPPPAPGSSFSRLGRGAAACRRWLGRLTVACASWAELRPSQRASTPPVPPPTPGCRTTLQGVAVALAATAVTLTVLINSQLDADGAYGVCKAWFCLPLLSLVRRSLLQAQGLSVPGKQAGVPLDCCQVLVWPRHMPRPPE